MNLRPWLPIWMALTLPASTWASDCFDHYNPEAWKGDGLAIVLCRNNSESSQQAYITSCEIQQPAGTPIKKLKRHAYADKGRVVYTAYDTPGEDIGGSIVIACTDRSGQHYTFDVGSASTAATGCCAGKTCGSTACCKNSCDSAPEPEDIDVPKVDIGDPGDAPACPPTRSDEYAKKRTLDVLLGSKSRLAFHVDLPNPSRLTYASLSMRLGDADHPRQEGTIYINNKGPLSVPARTSWNGRETEAELGLPLQYLRQGKNLVEFGAGTLARSYYSVSRVAVTVYGKRCGPTPSADAGPRAGQDATPDMGVGPDAGAAEPDSNALLMPPTGQDPPIQASPPSEGPSADHAGGGCSSGPARAAWPHAPWVLGLLVLYRRSARRKRQSETRT